MASGAPAGAGQSAWSADCRQRRAPLASGHLGLAGPHDADDVLLVATARGTRIAQHARRAISALPALGRDAKVELQALEAVRASGGGLPDLAVGHSAAHANNHREPWRSADGTYYDC